jgi:hypothetical protein
MISAPEAMRSQCFPARQAVDLVGRQCIVEPEDDRAIADRARKADATGHIGADEDGVAWRSDNMPAQRVVFGENTREGQHHGIQALAFDIAAGIRDRTGHERTYPYRVAFEQRPPGDGCDLAGISHGLCSLRGIPIKMALTMTSCPLPPRHDRPGGRP